MSEVRYHVIPTYQAEGVKTARLVEAANGSHAVRVAHGVKRADVLWLADAERGGWGFYFVADPARKASVPLRDLPGFLEAGDWVAAGRVTAIPVERLCCVEVFGSLWSPTMFCGEHPDAAAS